MNNKTDIDVRYVSPLKKICMTIGELPASYLETMSYYEMLVWFTEFLKNTIIPTVNNNAEAVSELQALYEELRTYVNDYFDNLDVQDEINNKLEEMAESGQLTDIIAQYLGLAGMIAFDTVADMKQATNLVNGSKCCTLGYYAINDGGGATYSVSTSAGNIHSETLQNNLYANIIVENDELNVLQLGVVLNDTTASSSNVTLINSVVNKVRTLIFPSGITYVDDSINVSTLNHNLIGTAINNCNIVYNGDANNGIIKIGDSVTLISGVLIKKLTFGTYQNNGITNNINAIEYIGVSPTHNIVEECVFRYFKNAIIGGHLGNVNNVTIRNNNIYTCYNGINMQYTNGYQVNAVYISENDISGCDNCGIIMYGNNMIVEKNTIQNCKNYGISVGENIEHSYNQYCLNSTIDNNYFELNGSVANDAVILLVGGYQDGSTYNRSITDLSIKNNFFAESIAKLNVISSNYHGSVSISADNNYSFYIKNGDKLRGGSIITSPGEQSLMPYNIEQSNAYALHNPNEYFYNVFNKNYYATSTPAHVDADKQTSIIIYATQPSTSIITNNNQLAEIKANLIGTLGTNYWASNFNYETKSNATTNAIGSYNYEKTTGINTPIISPIYYCFYSNRPTGATIGYVHVIKVQGNSQASEFNVYIEMISNLLTARGYKVKINENENKDTVNSVPTETPATDKDKLVYCTADSSWYGFYGGTWHKVS